MAYIRIANGGYQLFDEDHKLLFATDKKRDYLFDYVSKDLSCLPNLFEQYISAQMDTKTLKLNSRHPETDEITDKIKRVLALAHPYYKNYSNLTIIKEIGRYFNTLLIYLSLNRGDNLLKSEDWYKERMHGLLRPLTLDFETYAGIFYNEYQKRIAGGAYSPTLDGEVLLSDAPINRPKGFSDEIRTQKEITNMLYFILDISVPELERLTAIQRAWLYGNILNRDESLIKNSEEWSRVFNNMGRYGEVLLDVPLMKVSQAWSLTPLHRYYIGDHDQQQGHIENLGDIFKPLSTHNYANWSRDGIPADLKDQVAVAVELAATQKTNPIYVEYEVDDLRQVIYLEVLTMIQAGTMVKKCKYCGKYFIVTNRNISYCNRINESGVRCSSVGPFQNFQKKMEADEALKIYNRAYKTHHARVRKGTTSEEDFRLWYSEAREKLDQARDGKLDIDSFQKWLKI